MNDIIKKIISLFYKVIIVGGGFTGLCAKLFLCNYGIDAKIIDPDNDNLDYLISNYCGFNKIKKSELKKKICKQIQNYDNNFLINKSVLKIEYKDNEICVICHNVCYTCVYLLICTGFVYKKLDLKININNTNICEYLDMNDLNKYFNKNIVVIGGGDRSITYFEAIYNICKSYTILCRSFSSKMNIFLNFNIKLCNFDKIKKINIYNNVYIDYINDNYISFLDKKNRIKNKINYDFLIIAIGIVQNKINVYCNKKLIDIYNSDLSYVNETYLKNLFLGGISKKNNQHQQIINVMNDGSIFAMEVYKRIYGLEHKYF